MRFIPLSKVAPAIASGAKHAADEMIWHLTLDQIVSGTGRIENRVYAPASEAGASTFFFDKGNVLYSKLRPYLNKVVCPDSSGVATTELVPLRPDPNALNREYLCYYLRSPEFVSWVSSQVAGAKMPRVNMKSFWSHEIPLPCIDHQIRIAHLLGMVEGLITQRKQHLQQLDDLLKSVFLEMFGNLFLNDKSFDVFTLDQIKAAGKGTFSNGPFGSDLLTSELSETGEVPVIYIRDIRDGRFAWVSGVYVTKEKALSLPNCKATIGDVLIAKVGDPPGIAAVNSQFSDAIITQDVIRLRVDTSIANPHFVQSLLNSSHGKWLIKKISIKGTRSRFPLSAFKDVRVPVPPVDVQNHFATVVEKVEAVKSRYQQSLTDLETLYGALSQKAFKGELDLSRVVVATERMAITEDVKVVIPVVTETETKPAIGLPAPDDLKTLASAEGRKALIGQWLDAYLAQLGNGAVFFVEEFMEAAQQRLWDLQEDEAIELGLAEYDHIKDWVFRALESGHLTQIYPEDGNWVRIVSAKGP
jgi:type I restriction enzyme, S subunit